MLEQIWKKGAAFGVVLSFCFFSNLTISRGNYLSMIAGIPDPLVDSANEIIFERFRFGSYERYEEDLSTFVYSLLQDQGIRFVTAFEVIHENGSAKPAHLHQAINGAAFKSKIVLSLLGPPTEEICQSMAKESEAIFVLPGGSQGRYLTSEEYPSCDAPNLVLVGSLDSGMRDLHPNSNYGAEIIKIAAPGTKISGIGSGERVEVRSGSTIAASFVAAKLAYHFQSYSSSHRDPVKILEEFYEEMTLDLPELQEKVKNGRALDWERLLLSLPPNSLESDSL
jgi:hypothetical protein